MAKKGGVATNLNGFLNPTTTSPQTNESPLALIESIDDSIEFAENNDDGEDYDLEEQFKAFMNIEGERNNPTNLDDSNVADVNDSTDKVPINEGKKEIEGLIEQEEEEDEEADEEEADEEDDVDIMNEEIDPSFTNVSTPIGIMKVAHGKCQHYRPRYQDMCPLAVRSDGFANFCPDHTKYHFSSHEDKQRKLLEKRTLFEMQMKRHFEKQKEKDEAATKTFIRSRTLSRAAEKSRKQSNSLIEILLKQTSPVVSVPKSIAKSVPKKPIVPVSPPKKSISKPAPTKLLVRSPVKNL